MNSRPIGHHDIKKQSPIGQFDEVAKQPQEIANQ